MTSLMLEKKLYKTGGKWGGYSLLCMCNDLLHFFLLTFTHTCLGVELCPPQIHNLKP